MSGTIEHLYTVVKTSWVSFAKLQRSQLLNATDNIIERGVFSSPDICFPLTGEILLSYVVQNVAQDFEHFCHLLPLNIFYWMYELIYCDQRFLLLQKSHRHGGEINQSLPCESSWTSRKSPLEIWSKATIFRICVKVEGYEANIKCRERISCYEQTAWNLLFLDSVSQHKEIGNSHLGGVYIYRIYSNKRRPRLSAALK